MPSEQVIEKLEALQMELETISAAIKHIDTAAQIAGTAAETLKSIPVLLKDLKTLEEKHRTAIITEYSEKISALGNKLQDLLGELIEKSNQVGHLIDETKNLEKIISDYYTEIKKIKFPERLDKIDNQISAINIGVGNIQTGIQNTQTKVDAVQSSINSTTQTIVKRFSDIEDKIIEENSQLKKELKSNRTIIVLFGSLLIIGIIIVTILCHN